MMQEMMQELCTYEAAVSEAVQSGFWDEETSSHVASCIHCSEMIHVAEWTRSLSAEPGWPPLRRFPFSRRLTGFFLSPSLPGGWPLLWLFFATWSSNTWIRAAISTISACIARMIAISVS